MSFYINNKYRIKRSDEYERIMSLLIRNKIFTSYRDMLVISAIIGFNNELRIPIEKQASDGVQMQFFKEDDYDLMNLIAFAEAKSKTILDDDKKYLIFEEYANGGFKLLLQELNIIGDEYELDRKALLFKIFNLTINNLSKKQEINELFS